MIEQLKNSINRTRLNTKSYLRKIKINRSVEESLISHLRPERRLKLKHSWYGTSYGGFYIIPDLLNKDSVVYSFGIGKDISFDLKCIRKHKCNVFAFDPTPKSINWLEKQTLSSQFQFFNYGISACDSGLVDFFLPAHPRGVSGSTELHSEVDRQNSIKVEMKRFKEIVDELGHLHIDVLKMDIEGSEYDVLIDIMESDITIDQILVEFHDRLFDTELSKSTDTIEKLRQKGYILYASSLSFEEISLVHSRILD